MTNRKTTRPEANNHLPLDPAEIDSILRSGVLDVTCRSRDLVDDLVQDAWVTLLRRRHLLATVKRGALRAYIRRIATSTAVDRIRNLQAAKRGHDTVSVSVDQLPALSSRSADPESTAIHRQALRGTVRRAAGRGRRSLAILKLLYLGGLAPEVAAARLGISRSTVYSTVHRARLRLAQQTDSG